MVKLTVSSSSYSYAFVSSLLFGRRGRHAPLPRQRIRMESSVALSQQQQQDSMSDPPAAAASVAPSPIHANASSCAAAAVPKGGSSRPQQTFYQRALPESCVAFSSRRGRRSFESAMRHRGLKSFFHLMEQHSTQSEPAFCGISTLVIALNALSVDPRQVWKGSWRWYEESMLNCCVDLEEVKQTGITINAFKCLAVCQGLSTHLQLVDRRGEGGTQPPAHPAAPRLTTVEDFRRAVLDACVEKDTDAGDRIDRVLIASYSRKVLGQTGSGHFSPIAAYDQESDSVLIMDTARFKYGAHWVQLSLLFDAMVPVDPDTGRSRGYIMLVNPGASDSEAVLSRPDPSTGNLPISILLRTEMKQNRGRSQLKRFLERLNGAPSFDDVKKFCTNDFLDRKFVWELTQPHYRPYEDDVEAVEVVKGVRAMIKEFLASQEQQDWHTTESNCRPNHCRTIQLEPEEAIVIVYLSCLGQQMRQRIMERLSGLDRYKAQLLTEADLFRRAIDNSKQLEDLTQE
jgi:glutathione gamma-glutamylcysteinyltransferase